MDARIQALPFDPAALRAAGVNARYLRGGIDGWRAAARTLDSKRAAP